ncbi:flagellar brake protein [Simiduia aestuariiviva]|uniref:C-di-GMP-binding flagellar brake protein YcgR n=1 Tax=Simiduia aestuariiviva TaxID=1510459 RepID=A0A839USG4_9GAMM|nr:flagellar brake protein [Simiduia aestuariiviva]MBB3169410.1 c-di-GMP-binding flagellar brake protein YcgR [Simiduia aestuariiviva]
MKFEEFKLPFGYPLAIEGSSAGGEPFKYASKLVGCWPGEVVIISLPRAASASQLRSGQKLLIKIMAGNGVMAFASVVEQILPQPRPLIYLRYPTKLSFKEVRGATRVESRTPITVHATQGIATESANGFISDISLSGARIELSQSVGEVGTPVTINGDVAIAKLTGQLELPAVIRSRIERSTREEEAEYPAIYGIEFADMSDEQRLLLYAYVFSLLAK